MKSDLATITLLLGSLIPLASPAASAEAEWRVGLARVKITPEGPIRLDGYAERNRPSEGVLSDLYAKAMAIEDRDGHRAVLITADLIGFAAPVGDAIRSAIAEKTGLTRKQILLNCSHTHSAPVVVLRGYRKPSVPEGERRTVLRYNKNLRGQLADLAVAGLADLKPAVLSWGTGKVGFVVNRRERTRYGWRIGVNREGFADRTVPVLRVDSPDGALRAVVFGCACHGVTLTQDNYLVSGDYAGFAQEHIEKEYAGAQAMFMIGCAGSANPDPRGTADMARAQGKALGAEVCRVLTGDLKPVRGPLRTELARAEIPLAPTPSREELERIVKRGPRPKQFTARRMLAALAAGSIKALPTHYPMPIALWQFGDDLTLVGLSGEVVSEYVPLLRDALGPERLWLAAYCNDVFGYVVTAKILEEGGYETRGLFHQIGFLSPKAQDTILTTVRDLAQKAGRRVPER
ncbi:MAG: hypothetical protein GXP25_18730 [Planctomycetes bacterium]|nr:hypothetical protein [Planctomycetota bacterium]